MYTRFVLSAALVLVSACSLQTRLGGEPSPSAPTAARPSTGGAGAQPAKTAGPGKMIMPDLIGRSREEAVAALHEAGLTGEITYEPGACGSTVDGRIIEIGQVCRQHPVGGREHVSRLDVSVLIQHEDPRHGNVGERSEWHLMPDVVGMTVDEARRAIRDAGFDEANTQVIVKMMDGCDPGRVCRQNPTAWQRSNQSGNRLLYIDSE